MATPLDRRDVEVAIIGARPPIFEVIAIAVALFALMLWLDLTAEGLWLIVLVLAAGRQRLASDGLDVVLLDGRTARSACGSW